MVCTVTAVCMFRLLHNARALPARANRSGETVAVALRHCRVEQRLLEYLRESALTFHSSLFQHVDLEKFGEYPDMDLI